MKTVITFIMASMLSLGAFASDLCISDNPGKFCAKIKDGNKVVMYKGAILTSEVTLKNGTKIQTDGTVVQTDGTITILRTGECVSEDGTIAMGNQKGKP